MGAPTPQDLYYAPSGRWGGLGDIKRAAPELYAEMRRGHANIREWILSAWGTAPRNQEFNNQWHSATVADMRLEEADRMGPTGKSYALAHDDQLETLLRQLASAREFKLTGDASAAERILAVKAPGSSILPAWLADEARAHSTALWKQGIRTRGSGKKGDEKGNPKGRGRGAKGTPGGKNT